MNPDAIRRHANGVAVNIDKNGLMDDAERALAERLLRAAIYVENAHQQKVGVSFFVDGPSKEGEYPHKRTGQGQANIIHGPLTVEGIIEGGLRVRVGARKSSLVGRDLPLPHLVFLERFRGRLGFRDTAKDLQGEVRAILES